MPHNDGITVTLRDAIHAGITLGVGQQRTLDIWRAFGGEIRDVEFAREWREELERFKNYTDQTLLDTV